MRIKAGMIAAVALLVGSTWAGAQTSGTVKDDLFVGTEKFAANASSVTEVDMDPDSLGMVNGQNALRARRTVLSVVHTYTYDKPGMYNMADVEAFRNKLNTGEWHCSVHVREMKSGQSTDVCRKHRTDEMEETAIVTVEPKELTFIHTIKRPYTQTNGKGDGKSGGGESRMVMPFDLGTPWDMPEMDGVPAAAWSAEMRANAAEMRAMAEVDRAEMQAMMPALRVNLLGTGALILGRPSFFDGDQLRDLTRQLNTAPNLELRRFMPMTPPPAPTAPRPGTPPASSLPTSPATGPAPTRALPPPPLPPARA